MAVGWLTINSLVNYLLNYFKLHATPLQQVWLGLLQAAVAAETGPVQQQAHRGAAGLLVADAGLAVHGPVQQLLLR